ncbi:MAG TPA: class I SAM-dependent methyltransferase [Candidatus Methanoperedens sp.]|nr:class I SAM-dependent methyltransferase [Candidatus Methanoperedens sp.]
MAEGLTAPPGAPERPDVDALMERVRAGVADKLARGVWTQEELDRIARMELEIRPRVDFGPEPTDDLARLHALWSPSGPYRFTSHRGRVGRVIVAVKGLLHRLFSPVAAVVLARQTEYNGAVTRLLNGATLGVRALEESHEALLLRHDELERSYLEVVARGNELLTEVRRLQARLESVERAGLPAEALVVPPRTLPDAAVSPLSYLAFEEKHRGPGEAVKEKQRVYVRHFAGVPGPVLDAGCGRGEFLELLREAGIPATGVDADAEMAARGREKGLQIAVGDLFAHLGRAPDGSLGGIFAAQVIEHLSTAELVAFVRLAHAKLAPGGRLVAETINPTSLATFSGAFYLDLTHTRPVHPEALRFLLEATGFRQVELEFTAPIPDAMKLQPIDVARWLHDADREFVRLVNDNFGRLNALVYGCQDYAAVATR